MVHADRPRHAIARFVSIHAFGRSVSTVALLLCTVVGLRSAMAEPSVVINEFVTTNILGLHDEDGSSEDWIELTNVGHQRVAIGGYALTDDENRPMRWRFPDLTIEPGTFVLVFASGKDRIGPELHASFKLGASGEQLTLRDANGTILDQVDTDGLLWDTSRGRRADAWQSWCFFYEPTPQAPNEAEACNGITDPPTIEPTGGPYDAGVTVTLRDPDTESVVRFTLDGSEPTTGSTLYTTPFAVDTTTVVRARAFASDRLPSSVATTLYLIDDETSLPVMSLATDPENLWDNETGIYAFGDGYDPDFPYFGANFWEGWERPVHIQFIDEDGRSGFGLDAGLKIHGGWSRALPQKSFRLILREGYGCPLLDYELFDDTEVHEFRRLILRNSGNEWSSTHLRDAVMHRLAKGADLGAQAYRPVVVYLNGVYWGIYNLREKQDEHYLRSHHGVDAEDVDLLEGRWEPVLGSSESYEELLTFIKVYPLGDETYFASVRSQVDTDNFATYCLFEIYCANRDWLDNNIRFWRLAHPGSRWRWLLYDLDFGLGWWHTAEFNSPAFAIDPDGEPGWNPPWSTLLLRSLIENDTFRRDFINRYADLLNTTFAADNVESLVDEMSGLIEAEMSRHMPRWGFTVEAWRDELDVMRAFIRRRPDAEREHLQDTFGLSETYTLNLSVDPPGSGRIDLAAVSVESDYAGQYFVGNPVALTAVPAVGHRFARWSDESLPAIASVTIDPSNSYGVVAEFEAVTGPDLSVVINEINYNSSTQFDPDDWIELHNSGAVTVDLSGWVFRDGDDDHSFVFPSGVVLEPGGSAVLCRRLVEFRAHFPHVNAAYGDMTFGLNRDGERLRLWDAAGRLIDSVRYRRDGAWPARADGNGPTLELRDPDLDNAIPGSWGASALHGTPGAPNSLLYTMQGAPTELVLLSAGPNPFAAATTCRFGLADVAPVRLAVYDVAGREIETLLDEEMGPGWFAEIWRPTSLANGVYFLRLTSGNTSLTHKVIILR